MVTLNMKMSDWKHANIVTTLVSSVGRGILLIFIYCALLTSCSIISQQFQNAKCFTDIIFIMLVNRVQIF